MAAATKGGSPEAAREINVTPMLDVMLVLLVIFLAALPQHRTMDAALPQPCEGDCAGTAPIVLEVRPGPSFRINGAPVAPEVLGARLRTIYAARPEKVLQIAGWNGVTYQQMIDAMDVARTAGVRVIGLPDERPTPRAAARD